MADRLKLTVALMLVFAGVAGFYALGQQMLLVRVLSVVAGLVAGGVVFWLSEPGQRFKAYGADSLAEMRKVVWPERKETFQSTAIVFVFVVIMALMLWLSDTILQWVLYDLLLGWKS